MMSAMQNPCSLLLKLLFLVTLFTGASPFAGEKFTSGDFYPAAENAQEKSTLSNGNNREKMSSVQISTSDLLIKEKEQKRIKEAQLIGEIGSQI